MFIKPKLRVLSQIRIVLVLCVSALYTIGCASSTPTLQDTIVGKWRTQLTDVPGLGDMQLSVEFYKDGTATYTTDISSFVGDDKFIADDTIRIDWKEQTIFGNSTSNVYKVKIDNGVLTLTDSGGKPNIYYKFDEQGERSFANARATERAANSTPIPDAAKASDVDKILIVDNANSIEDDQLKPTAQQVVDKSARLLNRRYLGL